MFLYLTQADKNIILLVILIILFIGIMISLFTCLKLATKIEHDEEEIDYLKSKIYDMRRDK